MVLWFLKCLHQCKCKNKSNRRTTSQLLNGLSPGNFKGNVSVYYRSTGVLKRGGTTFADSLQALVGGIF